MDNTKKLLRDLQPRNSQPNSVPIATDMYIPNHSGTHDAGILLKTPSKDIDLVNKKYVDDELKDYVPYTGATTDVDLGANSITAQSFITTGGTFYYDGTSGNIDTDLVAPSDLVVDCGTDKTLVLEESVWNDIQFNIETGRVGAANFPDWDTTFTANTGAYKFDVNDFIDLGAQEMLHDWKEETSIYFHVHTALDGANASGSSQYAKFTVYVAYADEDGVFTETNKDIEIEIPTGTADLTHLFGAASALAMTGLTIGTQMNIRLKRIAATTGTEYPNHIFVTQVGIHYEVDTLGSRQIGTK